MGTNGERIYPKNGNKLLLDFIKIFQFRLKSPASKINIIDITKATKEIST